MTYHPSFRPQDDDQMQADKLAVSIYKHLHTYMYESSVNIWNYMYDVVGVPCVRLPCVNDSIVLGQRK